MNLSDEEKRYNYRHNKPEFREDEATDMSSPFGPSSGGSPFNRPSGGGPFGRPSVGGGPFGRPSMGGGPGAGGSPFGRPSMGGSPFGGPSAGGSPFGGGPGGGGSPFSHPGSAFAGMQEHQEPEQKGSKFSQENIADTLLDGLKTTARGTTTVVKATDKKGLSISGSLMVYSGGVMVVLALIRAIAGVFIRFASNEVAAVGIAGVVTAAVGGFLLYLNYDPNAIPAKPAVPEPTPLPEPMPMPSPEPMSFESDEEDYEEEEDEEDDADWDDDWDDDDDEEDEEDEDDEPEPNEAVDLDSALSSIQEIPAGTQTRSYLIEQYKKILPHSTPDFYKWSTHEEGSSAVREWEGYISESMESYNSSVSEDDIPTVTQVRENKYVIEITCKKSSSKFKPKQVAEELAAIYAIRVSPNPETGRKRDGVTCRVESAGSEVMFTLLKGTTGVIVTLADAMGTDSVKNLLNDAKNVMPVVIGVNELGVPLGDDFSKEYSMLDTGLPRSGKSWTNKSLVLQICMYNSPAEVNFYIGDSKGATSDYYNLALPHIKAFKSDPEDIVAMLRWIVNREAERRKEVLSKAGFINYNDYVKSHPDAKKAMPVIYYIQDEMMTLTSSFETKEEKQEYNNLLRAAVSQLPAMGIRFIFIPHRRTNTIIPKEVSDLVHVRACLQSNPEQVEETTGAKPSEFKYSLVAKGEMAISWKTKSPEVLYARGVSVACDDADFDKIARFIATIWSRLDHEYYHGPFIDELDKRHEVFDDYSCGCKSRGGYAREGARKTIKPATSGASAIKESEQFPQQGYNDHKADRKPGLRGGYTETTITQSKGTAAGGADVFDDKDTGFSSLFDE